MDEDRFSRYEENFINTTRIIARGINQLESSNGNADVVISSCADIEFELFEAEGYVKAMDVEFRTITSADKRSAQKKVSEYREEYEKLVKKYEITKETAHIEALKTAPSDRSKLLSSNQSIDKSSLTLQKSKALVAETEEVGNEVLSDLETQKEKLVDAQDKVQETTDHTEGAKGYLKIIEDRAFYWRIAVMMSIVFLFFAICFITYFGLLAK